jgi:hypothetical protein
MAPPSGLLKRPRQHVRSWRSSTFPSSLEWNHPGTPQLRAKKSCSRNRRPAIRDNGSGALTHSIELSALRRANQKTNFSASWICCDEFANPRNCRSCRHWWWDRVENTCVRRFVELQYRIESPMTHPSWLGALFIRILPQCCPEDFPRTRLLHKNNQTDILWVFARFKL